ncbi:MAG: hydantoinase B/oxoprolinase family protein [Alphaproteobacteria bacterium]|nr:hydantoinase B/oxoprolinase family protein [Alphaproteobacteria bacterium]
MTIQVDPVTFSVIWGGLVSASAEMGATLRRTAYSSAVREGTDYSTGMFDAEGNMVSQGDYSPGHLGSMAYTVGKMLQYYPADTLRPGDAIISNDPGIGSGHLPDVYMVCPIFFDDELIGFAVNIAHQIDIGGAGSGSQVVHGILDNYQEGIRFLPTMLYRAGEPSEEIFRIIEANVRMAAEVIGDIRAQYIANQAGGARMQALARSYGVPVLRQAMRDLIERSEVEMREAINRLKSGTYHFEDRLDDVGPDTEPVVAKVAVTIADGTVTVDWTGSGPQREAGLNAYLSYTNAYALAAVKAVTLPLLPQNAGLMRTIRTVAPEGCFFNPRRPAPCGGRATVSHRIYEVIMGALAQAAPDKVIAANSHFFNPNIGIHNPRTGRMSIVWETIIGGVGAREGADGAEALASPWNGTNMPAEMQEISCPILVERVELIPDSAGPGRWRGGSGMRKDMRMLAPDGNFYNLGDRHRFAPYGLAGGKPGALGRTIVTSAGGDSRAVHSKGNYRLGEGDVVSWQTAGAGGFGDPLERDPAAVLRDVLGNFVSRESAKRDYGVVLAGAPLAVDAVATEKLRREMRAA